MVEKTIGIGLDWGSTNIRAWTFSLDGTALAESRLSLTLRDASKFGFAHALSKLLTHLQLDEALPIVACGMVGAADGWRQVPYCDCPATQERWIEFATPVSDPALDALNVASLHILPGLANPAPRQDVMRGEETQLFGAIRELGSDDKRTFCLPGTHSKWVEASKGQIESYRTFVTGEVFALLEKHSLIAALAEEGPWDEAAFEKGLEASGDNALLASLFQTRVAPLLNGWQRAEAYWYLSGLLIGTEVRSASLCGQNRASDEALVLIADGRLKQLYETAFHYWQLDHTTMSVTSVTQRGLFMALKSIINQRGNHVAA